MREFMLPSGNVQISFSGGRSSGYMLHRILEANGGLPARANVVFANTGREMPQTLDFVAECGERWGVPIVWVEDAPRPAKPLFRIVDRSTASQDGEPFSDLIRRKRSCPDQGKRFCTQELKIAPARRYLLSLGWRHWTNAVGIRGDEFRRVAASKDKRVTRWHPMADAGVTKRDVLAFWKRQPFDLKTPTGLGNCDGCFLKAEGTLATLARAYPQRAAWWEKAEQLASNRSGSKRARFRSEYTRTELRQYVEKQPDWVFEEESGVLCQASGGECVV